MSARTILPKFGRAPKSPAGQPSSGRAGIRIDDLEPRLLLAAMINTASGDFRDGGQVTLTGMAFGPTGPNIVIFDNFEGGADGAAIRTGPGSATVGAWNARDGQIAYSSLNKVSGSLAARANQSAGFGNNVTALLPPDTRDLFVSYSTLIPAGTRWPGEGNPDGINWKTVWAMRSGSTDNDRTLPSHFAKAGLTEPDQHSLFSNSGPNQGIYFGSSIKRGEWLQTAIWVKGRADATGAFQVLEVTPSGVQQKLNRSGIPTLLNSFAQIKMNAYGRRTNNSFPTFDDFYVSTGPGARARVVVGNRPTYADSTVLAITTPTFWSNTEIRTTIRQGQFRPGDTAYLFVVDANGVVSELGHPITIGAAPVDPIAHVTQVIVNGPGLTGQTSADGINFRRAAGIDDQFGYPVPSGTRQLKSIPWDGGVDRVALRFDSDVASRLQQGDLVVRGVNTSNYAVTGFTYDAGTNTGVWTLSSAITRDKVRLFLDDAQLSGLDGEWTNGGASETYPSGNGTRGGDFGFRINVLRGDATQDGRVNALDLGAIKQRLNRTATNPGSGGAAYSVFADLTSDGIINALDLAAARTRLNLALPTREPASLFSSLPLSA